MSVDDLNARVLRGDILKALFYRRAFGPRARVGSLLLWSALREAGHREGEGPLGRETLERFVDELAARGHLKKTDPGAVGRLFTDYEVHLTRKGRGLVEGAVPPEADILIGEL